MFVKRCLISGQQITIISLQLLLKVRRSSLLMMAGHGSTRTTSSYHSALSLRGECIGTKAPWLGWGTAPDDGKRWFHTLLEIIKSVPFLGKKLFCSIHPTVLYIINLVYLWPKKPIPGSLNIVYTHIDSHVPSPVLSHCLIVRRNVNESWQGDILGTVRA